MIRFNSHIIPPQKGAYIVGGCIRDILTRRVPGDYDFVVLDNPRQFAMKIGEKTHGQVITLGKSGLTLYRVVSPTGIFDVSPVSGSSITEDLSRRDFTINAMAVDLHSGQLIDPFSGRADIENKKIRMVSNHSFNDDPIRLLRAYRLGALLGFDIEPLTENAITRDKALIVRSAGERIHAELIKIFETRHSFTYVKQMFQRGLMFNIFPELEALPACHQNRYHDFNVFDHTLYAYDHLETVLNNLDEFVPELQKNRLRLQHNIALLKYAILLHDIGKPPCMSEKNGLIHFFGHETQGAIMAEDICTRLKFSGYEKKYTGFIIRHHLHPLFLFSNKNPKTDIKKAKTKFFITCGDKSPDILLHAYADFMAKKKDRNLPENDAFKQFTQEMIRDYFTDFVPVKNEKRMLTGKDLIHEFRIQPSPLFKTILDQVEESRLSGRIHSRGEALTMARHILEIGNNHSSS
ncbi:MAG: HD domain-containing protein [Proteobacteria bacterium]|nr:HD domain-containing protein [Pseudomonadota bacterium]